MVFRQRRGKPYQRSVGPADGPTVVLKTEYHTLGTVLLSQRVDEVVRDKRKPAVPMFLTCEVFE